MTYTAHDPRLLADALAARLTSETGRPIGEAEAPSDTTTPYAVLYMLPDGQQTGALTDRTQIVWARFQVTCVGADPDEAQWMQQKARAALLGWAPTVTGENPTAVTLDRGAGITRDDDLQPPQFYTTDRFASLLT